MVRRPAGAGEHRGHEKEPVREGTDVATTDLTTNKIEQLLGDDADSLLNHKCETISADQLHLPGPDFSDRICLASDRSSSTLRNLQWLFDHGRIAGTGYVSILPVDQGIEHS